MAHLSGDEELRFKVGGGDMSHSFKRSFEGVIPNLERRYRETSSDHMREEFEHYMAQKPCEACGGQR